MGQTVGKPVERVTSKPFIEQVTPLDRKQFGKDPMAFMHERFETRASLEEWGFLWAHRILEEVFVRPELDMKWILNILHKEDLASIVPTSEIELLSIKPDSENEEKLEKLHKILTLHLTQQEEETEEEAWDK